MKMQTIKRVTVGGYVQSDVTGTGDWLVGQISKFDIVYIWFNPADKSKEVRIMRDQAMKATKSEFDEALDTMLDDPPDQDQDLDKIRLSPDLDHYVVGGDDGRTVTITNRKTVDIGDLVAIEFRAEQIEQVYSKAAGFLRNMGYKSIGKKDQQVPTTTDGLLSKYGHLNLGMQRMNLGNLVRNAMIRLGLDDLPTTPIEFN